MRSSLCSLRAAFDVYRPDSPTANCRSCRSRASAANVRLPHQKRSWPSTKISGATVSNSVRWRSRERVRFRGSEDDVGAEAGRLLEGHAGVGIGRRPRTRCRSRPRPGSTNRTWRR